MTTRLSAVPNEAHCDDEILWVALADGRRLGVPLAWLLRLLDASPEDRAEIEVSPFGLHWVTLGEEISAMGLMPGRCCAGDINF